MIIKYHDPHDGILAIVLSQEEVSAVMAANLPIPTELTQRGRDILKMVNDEITFAREKGIQIDEVRVQVNRPSDFNPHITTP